MKCETLSLSPALVVAKKRIQNLIYFHFYVMNLFYPHWAENFVMVDIEINAWFPLFLNLQIK